MPRSALSALCPDCLQLEGVVGEYFESTMALADALPAHCNGRWTQAQCQRAIALIRERNAGRPRGIIPYGEAVHIFRLLLQDTSIPFEMSRDGCYARARRMRNMLEQLGIDYQTILIRRSANDFLRFRDARGTRVDWRYHIAPALRVRREDGRTQTVVMDPSVLEGPDTIRSWAGEMGQSSCNMYESREQATADTASCSILLTRDRHVYAWDVSDGMDQNSIVTMSPFVQQILSDQVIGSQRTESEELRERSPRLDPVSGNPIDPARQQ